MNIESSLCLLIFKFFAIFGIAYISGWGCIRKEIFKNSIWNHYLILVMGAAILILSMLISSIIGLPAIYGYFVPFIGILQKLFSNYKNKNASLIHPYEKKDILLVSIFIILAGLNYLAPFISKNTSGFYSRGGGDHSSYLTLSEYFLSNSIWKKIKLEETHPTHTNWMANLFVSNSKDFSEVGPVANQFIASPYMGLLPGFNEETYTASVGFYFFLAACSYLFLMSIFLELNFGNFFIFPILLFMNPILIYITNTQAIPFLFSISLMNSLLALLCLKIKSVNWTVDHNFFIMSIIGSTLLMVYPHLYFLGLGIAFFMFFFLKGISFPLEYS